MRRNLVLSTILFFIGLIAISQNPVGELRENSKLRKIQFKKSNGNKGEAVYYESTINTQSKNKARNTSRTTSMTTARTQGEFSVSLSGAATYSVPFSLPPGINGLAPNVGLAYSSQASNGLAGWGWNIQGLSTITRIPSTTFHDGIIDAVDFDLKDRFALDGQRLVLKSGTYGAANSEYQTENYSNLKIKAYGTSPYGSSYGPSYFIVFYPNGTMSYYGNAGNSRGRLEWALNKTIDPQGNYIQYDYLQSNDLLRIDKITYGANGATASPNEIKFNYQTRYRPEVSYVNGYTFTRMNILIGVTVKGGGQLYRSYVLYHNITSLGYEILESITEYNALTQAFPLITFNYDSTVDAFTKISSTHQINPAVNSQTDDMRAGDVDADGKMDLIIYNKGSKNELNVIKDLFNPSGVSNAYEIPYTQPFDEVFTSNILSGSGQLYQKQGITTVTETLNTSSSSVSFSTLSFQGGVPVFEYEKIWNAPVATDVICINAVPTPTVKKIPKDYVWGDFNGDGLTDVLAITRTYNTTTCYSNGGGSCNCNNTFNSISKVDLINLKRNVSIGGINYAGNLQVGNDGTHRLFAADFDGDGKSDLIQLVNGSLYIYTITNGALTLILSHSNTYLSLTKPLLTGDFNGDGKMDFVAPQANNSSTWRFYLSKGLSIYSYSKDIGISYIENYVFSGTKVVNGISMLNPLYEYHYVPQDFNGDGKTDIIKHEVVTPYASNSTVSERIQVYSNKHVYPETTPSFQLTTNNLQTNNGLKKRGISIFLEASQTNSNLEYAHIDGSKVYAYEFSKDNRKDVTLVQITNDELVTDIYYENLNSVSSSSTYEFDLGEFYPYANINIAPSLKVVKEAKNTASGIVQNQYFMYGGAVVHAEGLGFLGFKILRRSNWTGINVPLLWNVSEHDMQKRGAVTQQWLSTSSSTNPSTFANETTYTYSSQLLANNVYVNVPTQIVKVDGLQNITTTETYSYDTYYNPLTINSSFSGGSNSITYTYSNNAGSTSNSYHIGRPLTKVETRTLVGNSFMTEVQYTYNNNLVAQMKKRGSGTPWLTEDFLYDIFGNLTQKTLSGTGVASRTEHFEYDSSGRFLTKSTDIEGLETTYTYNLNNGNPLTTINPYSLTTSFTYDGWDRLLTKTNYLGRVTNMTYGKEYVTGIGQCYTVLTDFPEGNDTKAYHNGYGWLVKSKMLSFDNKWIEKSTEYDAIGRKFRESEPYFDTASPTQWNYFYFDQYGRPTAHQLFTGKVIYTTYNGLNITVDDGVKTITTTRDAVGNIVTLQDPGGTINYTYHGNGEMKSANYGTHTVNTTIDNWGRKISLSDPSAGNYTYEYDILGQLTKETTPNGETNYTYDAFGKVTNKTITGNETNLVTNYGYDANSKLLSTIGSTDIINNKSYSYSYTYDSYKRNTGINETTDAAIFGQVNTFDTFGRIETVAYNTNSLTSGITSNVKTKNIYDTNGVLVEVRDFTTNNLLWMLNSENARRQILNVKLGNGYTQLRTYDQYGFLTNIKDHTKIFLTIKEALKLDYSFDAQRGILNNRKNYGFTNWTENFTHDSQDRLTQISGPAPRTQSYDAKGLITNNSLIGDYAYDSASTYRVNEIVLNSQGEQYYLQHDLQQVTYNAFKKPVKIYEQNGGRVDFMYGPMMNRTYAFYGGLDTNINLREHHKYYSSIIPVEIVENMGDGSTKIITYVGGDAYSAPIAYIKTNGYNLGDVSEYHYLHRDYLGSILAITDSSKNIIEERQFGAWGSVDQFKALSGATVFNHDSLLNRGFTGHEHFFEVGLIHMNGRMYDAMLGRFLSPDNFVQDPYNTQSFNRYGYVWSNPLAFNDISGNLSLKQVLKALFYIVVAIVTPIAAFGVIAGAVFLVETLGLAILLVPYIAASIYGYVKLLEIAERNISVWLNNAFPGDNKNPNSLYINIDISNKYMNDFDKIIRFEQDRPKSLNMFSLSYEN